MSNPRKSNTENKKITLYSEVSGICPLCNTDLMYEKNGSKEKKGEIAHIYPLNLKPDEVMTLKDVKKLSDDPNSLDNLIYLCVECHTKFDNPRTLVEYEKLYKIKSDLIKISKEINLWSTSSLEKEIDEIIDFLANTELDFTEDIISYNPKTITEKTNSSITVLTKRKIERNVQDYFSLINFKFTEIDKKSPTTSETISTQIKLHYLKLKKGIPDYNQRDIFEAMVLWLYKTSQNKSKESCEIIISYFIQNCEIFE